MESRHQRKSFPFDLFSSSFDKQARAEVANAQEQQRLVKQHRHLDLLKTDAVKGHTAAQTTMRARSSNLSGKKQARISPKKGCASSFPAIGPRKVSEGFETGRGNQASRETNKPKALVKLPFLTEKTNSSNDNSKLYCSYILDWGSLCEENSNYTSTRSRGRKEKNSKAQDDFCVMADRPRVLVHAPSPGFIPHHSADDPCFPMSSRSGLRRRSLSANDISLTGRVNAFLDNLSLKSLKLSADGVDSMIADDVDYEKDDSSHCEASSTAEAVGLHKCRAHQNVFLNSRLEENGQPRYIRMPSANRDNRT